MLVTSKGGIRMTEYQNEERRVNAEATVNASRLEVLPPSGDFCVGPFNRWDRTWKSKYPGLYSENLAEINWVWAEDEHHTKDDIVKFIDSVRRTIEARHAMLVRGKVELNPILGDLNKCEFQTALCREDVEDTLLKQIFIPSLAGTSASRNYLSLPSPDNRFYTLFSSHCELITSFLYGIQALWLVEVESSMGYHKFQKNVWSRILDNTINAAPRLFKTFTHIDDEGLPLDRTITIIQRSKGKLADFAHFRIYKALEYFFNDCLPVSEQVPREWCTAW